MVLFQKCCCLSLKQGSLIICYLSLTQEFLILSLLLVGIDEKKSEIMTPRNQSSSKGSVYFQFWMRMFNVIVVGTGLYGVYKEKVHLMIPLVAFKTVSLIFMGFDMANLRTVADNLNAEYTKTDKTNGDFDVFPLLLVIAGFWFGISLYCLCILYSYYQFLILNRNVIAVDVPIVIYTSHPHDHQFYPPQPPENPYLFQPKMPYPYDGSFQHPPSYAYSTAPNTYRTYPDPLPPPYRA